jgi:energy-coupling factor transporter ATP-binding protein EcfA2
MNADSQPSRSAAPIEPTKRLILITGQEGAGKTTIIRALLPHTPQSARIDGEDVAQINPSLFDAAFWELLRCNVGGLVRNFWQAGYTNVIAGSFFANRMDYIGFRNKSTCTSCSSQLRWRCVIIVV